MVMNNCGHQQEIVWPEKHERKIFKIEIRYQIMIIV